MSFRYFFWSSELHISARNHFFSRSSFTRVYFKSFYTHFPQLQCICLKWVWATFCCAGCFQRPSGFVSRWRWINVCFLFISMFIKLNFPHYLHYRGSCVSFDENFQAPDVFFPSAVCLQTSSSYGSIVWAHVFLPLLFPFYPVQAAHLCLIWPFFFFFESLDL